MTDVPTALARLLRRLLIRLGEAVAPGEAPGGARGMGLVAIPVRAGSRRDLPRR